MYVFACVRGLDTCRINVLLVYLSVHEFVGVYMYVRMCWCIYLYAYAHAYTYTQKHMITYMIKLLHAIRRQYMRLPLHSQKILIS